MLWTGKVIGMRKILILSPFVLALALCAGCSDAPSTVDERAASEDNSPEPPPPAIDVVDVRIDAIQNDEGKPIQQMKVGESITVQGSFRVPGGSKVGPPPTTVKLRDRNNVIHNSRGERPELRGEDEYVFNITVGGVSYPGDFTVEVSVLGNVIDQRDMKVVR